MLARDHAGPTPSGEPAAAPVAATNQTPGSATITQEGVGAVPLAPSRARIRWPWRLAVIDAVLCMVVGTVLMPATFGLALAGTWFLVLAIFGCYRPRLLPAPRVELRGLAHAVIAMVIVTEVASDGTRWLFRGTLLVAVLVSALASLAVRLFAWARWHAQARTEAASRRVVVIGDEYSVTQVTGELTASPCAFRPVAECVFAPAEVATAGSRHFDDVLEMVVTHGADAVIAVPGAVLGPLQLRRLAWSLEASGTALLVVPGLIDVVASRTTLTYAGQLPVLHVSATPFHGVRRVLKEAWERAVAALALGALLPLIGLLMLWVRLDSRGPAIYRQQRVGRDGRPFTMLKLRTMSQDADRRISEVVALNESDAVLFKMRRDPRITRAGAILRRYSLDELPQLWNVVRGDMALVGPRPPLPGEVATYSEDDHRRMAVKPGLTGLWQVSGRSDLPWDTAIRLDLFYVDNWSLGLDLMIIARTFRAVVRHSGAY